MNLLSQFIATAFQVVHDRLAPSVSVRPDTAVLNRMVYENHQLRLLLADTKKDLRQVADTQKLTKAQIVDLVRIMLSRIEMVDEAVQERVQRH